MSKNIDANRNAPNEPLIIKTTVGAVRGELEGHTSNSANKNAEVAREIALCVWGYDNAEMFEGEMSGTRAQTIAAYTAVLDRVYPASSQEPVVMTAPDLPDGYPDWFRRVYGYACTQTFCIVALSKYTPADFYHLVNAALRELDRDVSRVTPDVAALITEVDNRLEQDEIVDVDMIRQMRDALEQSGAARATQPEPYQEGDLEKFFGLRFVLP